MREPNTASHHNEKIEYGPLLIAPSTIRNITESIRNGENLNGDVEVDRKVLGNGGLVSTSDMQERDYSHITDPRILALLKGKYSDTVKEGLQIGDYFKLDEADEEGAHIKIKDGATPYRCISVRYTPYLWAHIYV